MSPPLEAAVVIARLGLVPLGFEGGYYRETYRSGRVLASADPGPRGGSRSAGTAIFYLLTAESRSLLHRLQTDEVYHFYLGDPVDLLLLEDGGRHEEVRLGPDILGGERVQLVVPAGVWQGSRLAPGGRWALMGTTMAPGFDLADFELGRRSELLPHHPAVRARIAELTPEVLDTPGLELTAATRDLLHAHLRGPRHLAAGLGADGVPAEPAPAGLDEASARAALARLDHGASASGSGGWYLVRREDRALVGRFGWHVLPTSGSGNGEVRLSLPASAALPGDLAREALEALVDHAFADPRVARVTAEIPFGPTDWATWLRAAGFCAVGGVFETRRASGPLLEG